MANTQFIMTLCIVYTKNEVRSKTKEPFKSCIFKGATGQLLGSVF
jgi:hypothetical protein